MKMLKKILAVGAILVNCIFAAPKIWDGTADVSWYDSSAQTFSLTTAEQLAGLAKLVNEGVSDFTGKTINLEADIFLNDTTKGNSFLREWTPIGSFSYPFRGKFDGRMGNVNHKIYGLYINNYYSYNDYIGFFGVADNEISNVDILIGRIIAPTSSYVGGLGGLIRGKITNVCSQIDVTGYKNYIGGLVGYAADSVLKSCSEGNVIGRGDYIGGLVGYVEKVVDSSYHVGSVRGVNKVGGLIGYANGYVLNSYSEGNVDGTGVYVGGLVGSSATTVVNSYFDGYVVGAKNYVGGLIGYTKGTVLNSHSTAEVVGKESYVGGLIGHANGSIRNSFSEGSVSGLGNYVGGLVGFTLRRVDVPMNLDYDTTYIDNSYYIGNVEGLNFVGGLIGADSVYREIRDYFADSMFIANAVRDRESISIPMNIARIISDNASTGNVKGNAYVGGLIGKQCIAGKNSQTYIRIRETLDTIKYNVYARYDTIRFTVRVVGALKANILKNHSNSSVSADSDYVGGLIGSGDDVESSYHVSGEVRGKNFVGGLAGYANLVKKSHSSGAVFANSDYVGGLVGNGDEIDSSYHISGEVRGMNYVGGLAGNARVVKKSYSNGPVSADSNYVGGLVGYGNEIESSYHMGGSVSGRNYVGGLIGRGDSANYSYHSGGEVNGVNYVGGLVGEICSIRESSSNGSVLGQDSVGGLAGAIRYADLCGVNNSYGNGPYVKGNGSVGGLIGHFGPYRSTYERKDSLFLRDSYFKGDSVIGNANVGGLVGTSYTIINRSFSTANVRGYKNVGGLVGEYLGAKILQSFAEGDVDGENQVGGLVGTGAGAVNGMKIIQSYANGNVYGNKNLGGIAGTAKGSFEESYVSGFIHKTNVDTNYAGCMVGFVRDSLRISKSYYDITKCDYEIEGKTKIAVVKNSPGKTTEEMHQQTTFENWDFTNVWNITANMYPYIQLDSNLHANEADFSLVNAVVTTESLDNFEYDGLEKTPQVISVELLDKSLVAGTDYTVSYENNRNAGTASINVCGLGVYRDCKEIVFSILPIPIELTIDPLNSMVYTGFPLYPKVYVRSGNLSLNHSDYKVQYADNLSVGIATISVKMKGNYSGSASQSFVIEKANPIISEKTSSTKKRLEILYGLGEIADVSLSARNILFGEPLDSSKFIQGVSGDGNVGKFVWVNPDTIPSLGTGDYEVLFIPSDSVNYKTTKLLLQVKVRESATVVVYDGSEIIDSAFVEKGTSYLLPYNLQKDTTINNVHHSYVYWAHDTIGYDFVGFYNGNVFAGQPGDRITINEDMKINATYKPQNFTVTWLENENVILYIDTVAYGTMPEFLGEPPKKGWQWAKHTYTFKGWTPEIKPVTGDIAYTAVFDSTVRIFAVTFINGESKLQEDSLSYGEIPKYKGDTPTKKSTDLYSYEFIGWSPKIGPVEKDMEFFAVFDSIAKTGIADTRFANLEMSVVVASRSIQISSAPVGSSYAIFDMQGRVLKQGRVDSSNFNIAMPIAGNYLVKVGDRTRRVSIR